MKKLISLALCAVFAVGSAVCANAQNYNNKAAELLLDDFTEIRDNTIKVYSYNLPEDTKHSVYFNAVNGKENLEAKLSECIENPQTLLLMRGVEYERRGHSYSFDDTEGVYVKVRVKLSEIASPYFNEDGTHTEEIKGAEHTFNFVLEPVGDDEYYDSTLVFQSGGAVCGAAPDEEGCVEFYISTNIGEIPFFTTGYSYRKGLTGTVIGGYAYYPIPLLTFGNVDLKGFVNINDATALQLILSGDANYVDMLQYFYADANHDGYRNVCDVTALQAAIVKSGGK